jgi:hypothetical protein
VPTPTKPCAGSFTEETINLLEHNIDREQWKEHRCSICGQSVMPEQLKNRWVPEQHWASVARLERKRPWTIRHPQTHVQG